MGTASLSVAHYGHPLLKGAKHWSFLLDTSEGCAITYQLTGSTNTYELKEPEEIEILESQTYLGRVVVGTIDTAKQGQLLNLLKKVPITRGNLQWNCQNWIAEALQALKENGFDVVTLNHKDLHTSLQAAKREN